MISVEESGLGTKLPGQFKDLARGRASRHVTSTSEVTCDLANAQGGCNPVWIAQSSWQKVFSTGSVLSLWKGGQDGGKVVFHFVWVSQNSVLSGVAEKGDTVRHCIRTAHSNTWRTAHKLTATILSICQLHHSSNCSNSNPAQFFFSHSPARNECNYR